ncbi:ankyrin repeat domain-containing protein [Candidatus Micrarchaeota archaeon]|nr:ankyrin repeat domain-containing protein [Candidatus Micrarchaeota archaeon]
MDWNGELIAASQKGDTEEIKLLIEKGVDVNEKEKKGDEGTALIWAVYRGHTETAELLIEKGADVEARDKNGLTALILAAGDGQTETVNFLIENGADVNAKDIYGWTALMWTAKGGNTKTAEFLIEKGADINAKDNAGWTALMFATVNGNIDIVELLIKKGANVVYVYKNNNARETINQLAREKPEIFTEEQRFIFEMYSNPENIPQDKKKKVIKVLREFQKKGLLSKEESLDLFSNLQKTWNKNMSIKIDGKIRKPGKSDKKNLRKVIN